MMTTDNSKTNGEPTRRTKAVAAYDRDAVTKRGATSQFPEAPLAMLAGGIAVGAVLAALLPTSRRERALLNPLTDSIKDRAAAAVNAAKDAGQARLDELGLTRDAGGETIRKIVDGATDALKTSAKAATNKVRGE